MCPAMPRDGPPIRDWLQFQVGLGPIAAAFGAQLLFAENLCEGCLRRVPAIG